MLVKYSLPNYEVRVHHGRRMDRRKTRSWKLPANMNLIISFVGSGSSNVQFRSTAATPTGRYSNLHKLEHGASATSGFGHKSMLYPFIGRGRPVRACIIHSSSAEIRPRGIQDPGQLFCCVANSFTLAQAAMSALAITSKSDIYKIGLTTRREIHMRNKPRSKFARCISPTISCCV